MPKSLLSTESFICWGLYSTSKISSSDLRSAARAPQRSVGTSFEPSGIQRLWRQAAFCSRPIEAAILRQHLTWSTQNLRMPFSRLLRVKPEAALGWAKQVALKSSFRSWRRAHSVQPRKWLGSMASRSTGLAAEFAVHGVEVEPVAAGDEGEGLLEVGPELLDGAGLARIGAGHLEAAPGQAGVLLFEAADVVALPAVEGQGDRLQARQGFLGVDAALGVAVAGRKIGFFDSRRIHPHPSSKERHVYMPPAMGCQASRRPRKRTYAASQAAWLPDGA